jgi:hypothetical protein
MTMKYQKPELVLMGAAITAIQASLDKTDNDSDGSSSFSVAAYRADE